MSEDANVNTTINLPSQHSFSYFGRVNYTLKGPTSSRQLRVLMEVLRFGRESRYASSHRFPRAGSFPMKTGSTASASAFEGPLDIGYTGNAALPDYARFGTYSAANNGITYAADSILYPIQPENPTLRWETSRTIDASVELGLLEDRITTELAFYHKYSTDVLMNDEHSGQHRLHQFLGQRRDHLEPRCGTIY